VSTALALTLLFFFPHLSRDQAQTYSKVIIAESVFRDVDPLITTSRIWAESGFRWKAVEPKQGNYGLMMVSQKVFDPAKNIRLGVRALAYWQQWHKEGKCSQKPPHFSWAHYTWGYRVPLRHRTLKQRKMTTVYRRLKRRMQRYAKTTRPDQS